MRTTSEEKARAYLASEPHRGIVEDELIAKAYLAGYAAAQPQWIAFADEKPKDGDKIFCLRVHWKNVFPTSFEIHGAVWENGRAETNDDSGKGSWCIEDINYWCLAYKLKNILPPKEEE